MSLLSVIFIFVRMIILYYFAPYLFQKVAKINIYLFFNSKANYRQYISGNQCM